MKPLDFQSFSNAIHKTANEFFNFVSQDHDARIERGFFDISHVTFEGITLELTPEISHSSTFLSEDIVKAIGVKTIHTEDARQAAYRSICILLSERDPERVPDPLTTEDFKNFKKILFEDVRNIHDFFGQCKIFDFQDCTASLKSEHIKILPAEDFVAANFPNNDVSNWQVNASASDWPYHSDHTQPLTVFGTVWWINTKASKSLTEARARWFADVFMSCVRIGIRKPDYCHRPKIGEIEAKPFQDGFHVRKFGYFNEKKIHFPGNRSIGRYKVTEEFRNEFHSDSFQKKLSLILNPAKNSLAERLQNSLAWHTRGRQASDFSERLLCFFTALEALLGSKDQNVPITENISRHISIIISKTPETREETFKEVKKLYSLRSALVHRGDMEASYINANNIEYLSERVLQIVWTECDHKDQHKTFIDALISASHGRSWP